MSGAEIAIAERIATSQAVWAIVAIILAYSLFRKLQKESAFREQRLLQQEKEYRQEAKEREERLMEHLRRSNDSQEKTAKALEGINKSLASLEGRVDRIEKHTYKKECS